MRAVGGRLKPWRQLLDAIRERRLTAWLGDPARPLATRLLVQPEDARPFLELEADQDAVPDAICSPYMSQAEAVALLNLHQKNGPALRKEGLLTFRQIGPALGALVVDVVRLAETYVTAAELAAREGGTAADWNATLQAALGPRPVRCGWPRDDVARIVDAKASKKL